MAAFGNPHEGSFDAIHFEVGLRETRRTAAVVWVDFETTPCMPFQIRIPHCVMALSVAS